MVLADDLVTESRNPRSESIDTLTALEFVRLMNSEDAKVVAAVEVEAEPIARAIEWAAERLERGGRIVYVGAGTSGRLGVLDAAECPPTFSTPPGTVVGLIAGGAPALIRAVEGAEDDPDRGAADIVALDVNENDLVIGIATSGRTPYVLGAVQEARRRGAATVGVACNRPSLLGDAVDLEIAPSVGPEIISGSTRLKGGTATKMVLNMISTGAMVRIGKTLGNWMVDLHPSNEKLRIRSRRILRDLVGVDDDRAAQILAACGGHLKRALVVALTGINPDAAGALLDAHHGQVRAAVMAGGGRNLP
jgi:N-acetylmuramic acid 6-phosphate etherase